MVKVEKTEETFEFENKELFSFNGLEAWKTWYSPYSEGKLEVNGYSEWYPSSLIEPELESATEDGRIVKRDKNGEPQDYLIEIKVKVTKLKRVLIKGK